VRGSYTNLISNTASNNGDGIDLILPSRYNTLLSNTIRNNTYGAAVAGVSNNLLISNLIYGNSVDGINLNGGATANTLISNSIYSNVNGISADNTSGGNVCVLCNIGYSSSTISFPNTSEITFIGGS